MPFFRRNKQWRPVGEFPTSSVQRLPFQRPSDEDGNKIIYTTRYEATNPEKCGIFEYDFVTKENRAIQLWSDCGYFPRWDVSVYNETEDSIFFVGGANVEDSHRRYEILMRYDLTKDKMTKVHFPSVIGGNARICLSDDDRYLHVIGGTSNYHHIMYDLRLHRMHYMYSFYQSYPQIQSCGLIHSRNTQKIYMFGGRSSFQNIRRSQPQRMCFDDFWCFDLKHNLASLSMKDCSWLLVNGWIMEEMYDHDKSEEDKIVDYQWPIELNDVVLRFLGIRNTVHIWEKSEKWTLPKRMYQFGSVLYKDRVIITFGGRDETNETIDDIWYLDLLDANSGWKESKLKCPKASTYNAAILDEDTVHIVPFYVHKDHYSIPIKRLLPSKLIDQITLDITLAAEEERLQINGGDSHEFRMDYKRMFHGDCRLKVMLSVLIGVILTAISSILLWIRAIPDVACFGGIGAGVLVIVVALLYGRCYRPRLPVEYLLFDKEEELNGERRSGGHRESLITG